MHRITRDEWAMAVALTTAKRSTCIRRNVGCVLLNESGHVLSTGYNGVASGMPHCNELESTLQGVEHVDGIHGCKLFSCPGANSQSGTNLDGCHAIHAEQNALLQCNNVSSIYACYTTTAPCMTCTKLLMNTPCKRIVFREDYPHGASRQLWERSGRVWKQLK